MTARHTILVAVLALVSACGTDTAYPYFYDTTGPADTAGDASDDGDAADGEEDAADVDPDVDTADDAGGSVGSECERNTDCSSLVCVPVGDGHNVCSESCADADCRPGWTCAGEPAVCRCDASDEVCDGLDNDCDGTVDDGPAEALGCGDGEACIDGECACRDICDGTCTDTDSDPGHCGECGSACSEGEECVSGGCVCGAPFDLCGGTCVDTRSDSDNCGECGRPCADGDACFEGECGCAAPLVTCDDGCSDLLTDRYNCGRCGAACADDEVCSEGSCECVCPGDTCAEDVCLPVAFLTGSAEIAFEFAPRAPRADVVFNMDTTGSMGAVADAFQAALGGGLGGAISEVFSDPAFAVTEFRDFPCSEFGSSTDYAFRLRQRVTTSRTAVEAAAAALIVNGGGDSPESGIESLFQIATGTGRTECRTVDPFDGSVGRVPGVADGLIGGVGFREGSLPIVVHVTDAPTHARGEAGYPYGATRAQSYDALRDIGARVVGIAVGTNGYNDVLSMASETGAAVPPCAWGGTGARPAGCSPAECCTLTDGSGTSPTSGVCPLALVTSSSAAGLDSTIADAIDMLARFTPVDVSVQVSPDVATFERTGVDTSCFVERVEVVDLTAPDSCGEPGIAVDRDDDGVNESVTGASGGATLRYEVTVANDCTETPGVYPVHIAAVGDTGTTYAEDTLYVVVPGE